MNRFKTIVEIESQKEYYQKLHQVIEKNMKPKRFIHLKNKSLEPLIYVTLMM